jgi:outer membrane protein TolC
MNALLDREATSPLPPAAWSDDLRDLPSLVELASKLSAGAPELRAARAEISRTDAGLALAQQEYFPDLTLMGAYTNKDGLAPEWELGVKVKVPLYFWLRQRAAVAEAGYTRVAASSERRNVTVTLDARLRELHSMAVAARSLIALYRDSLIPQASLTLESARSSYAVGKVDFLTTLTAFTSLLEYRMRYTEEVGNARRAQAEIAPLVGETPTGELVP